MKVCMLKLYGEVQLKGSTRGSEAGKEEEQVQRGVFQSWYSLTEMHNRLFGHIGHLLEV